MPTQDFIQVEVIVDDNTSKEYTDPEAEPETGQDQTRFIEVKTGQKFSVRNKWCSFAKFPAPEAGIQNGNVKTVQQHDFHTSQSRDKSDGEWRSVRYEFGALGVGEEDAPLPEGLSPSDLNLIGSLRIIVHRADRIELPVPVVWHGNLGGPLDQISERALKRKPIKNNVKYSGDVAIPAPDPIQFGYPQIIGDKGAPYRFKYLYRNRKILQSLGCIPRTPSPPPDPALMNRRRDEMIMTMQQELREMRNELTQVKSESRSNTVSANYSRSSTLRPTIELGVKTEPKTDTGAMSRRSTTIKEEHDQPSDLENPSHGTKRTRDEADLGDDIDLLEVGPPLQKPKIVVDLTLD